MQLRRNHKKLENSTSVSLLLIKYICTQTRLLLKARSEGDTITNFQVQHINFKYKGDEGLLTQQSNRIHYTLKEF